MAHTSRYRRKRKHARRSANRAAPKSALPPTQSPAIRYVTRSVQTDKELTEVKKKTIPDLESINRISNFPIVETSLSYAEDVYNKIKKSNSIFNFALEQAENTLSTVVDTAAPAFVLLQGPIHSVDQLVCKSLDFVEDKIPSINLPPEMIYWNTKQYAKDTVNTKIVRPVLKRADSVKQIGNTVWSSKYTAYAADTLDGALSVADKYVDKYLPGDDEQPPDDTDNSTGDGPAGKAIHTIHHADRLSRKLKRRLTKRTLAEVKALKEHSAEAVHVLIYVAELIATDPKLALKKGQELWASLSQDEPENQARPDNLEQLIVLLTRESSRRVVHFINYTSALVGKVPKRVSNSAASFINKLFGTVEQIMKTIHMENAQKSLVKTVRSRAHGATVLLKQINVRLTDFLVSYCLGVNFNMSAEIERLSENKTNIDIRFQMDYRFLAVLPDDWNRSRSVEVEILSQNSNKEQLAQRLDEQEASKTVLSVPKIKVQQLKAFHTNSTSNRNGVETNSTNSS